MAALFVNLSNLLLCTVVLAIQKVIFLFDREISTKICWAVQISKYIRLIISTVLKCINGIVHDECMKDVENNAQLFW